MAKMRRDVQRLQATVEALTQGGGEAGVAEAERQAREAAEAEVLVMREQMMSPGKIGDDMFGEYGHLGAQRGEQGGVSGSLGAEGGVAAAGLGSAAALSGVSEGASGSRREKAIQDGFRGGAAGVLGAPFGLRGGRPRQRGEEQDARALPFLCLFLLRPNKQKQQKTKPKDKKK